MNPEILIAQAEEAMKMFNIDHEGVCCLLVKSGFVLGVPASRVSSDHPRSLRIERYELRSGLTSARWHAIGRELFILYTKEKQCQSHPKP